MNNNCSNEKPIIGDCGIISLKDSINKYYVDEVNNNMYINDVLIGKYIDGRIYRIKSKTGI